MINNGTVQAVGKSGSGLAYSWKLSNQDANKLQYFRAYAKTTNAIVYSSILSSTPNTPYQILSAEDTMSNVFKGGALSSVLYTNIKNVPDNAVISLFFDSFEVPIIGKQLATPPNFDPKIGWIYNYAYPEQLPPGSYTLSLKINQTQIVYKTKVVLLEGKWRKTGEMPSTNPLANSLASGFVYNDFVYGYRMVTEQGPPLFTTFTAYNYKTNQSTVLKGFNAIELPVGAVTIQQGNLIHYIGGQYRTSSGDNCVNSHYIFNTATNQWSKGPDFPGHVRRNAANMLYNNKIYYGLGYDIPDYVHYTHGTTAYNDLWAYDLSTQTWQQLADFPQQGGRYMNAIFSINSKLYVVAGTTASGSSFVPTKETWCYDANADSWNKKTDFPGVAQINFTNFQLNNYGYVGLGESSTYDSYVGRIFSSYFYKYDPIYDKWQRVCNLPYAGPVLTMGVTNQSGLMIASYDSPDRVMGIYTFTP
ncbi:hypothetical protein BEL04_16735 [Mucilaginibacter sp. PPCGB 2223]|nr:hypothetical protein BEL04_16735 [Mucilaginibacter sp. PPCGB 2223]